MNLLVIGMSEQMARAVSKGTDILSLPTNQDFALRAMSLLLRSMGLASNTGRPIGYSQRRHNQQQAAEKRQLTAQKRRDAAIPKSRKAGKTSRRGQR